MIMLAVRGDWKGICAAAVAVAVGCEGACTVRKMSVCRMKVQVINTAVLRICEEGLSVYVSPKTLRQGVIIFTS